MSIDAQLWDTPNTIFLIIIAHVYYVLWFFKIILWDVKKYFIFFCCKNFSELKAILTNDFFDLVDNPCIDFFNSFFKISNIYGGRSP